MITDRIGGIVRQAALRFFFFFSTTVSERYPGTPYTHTHTNNIIPLHCCIACNTLQNTHTLVYFIRVCLCGQSRTRACVYRRRRQSGGHCKIMGRRRRVAYRTCPRIPWYAIPYNATWQ